MTTPSATAQDSLETTIALVAARCLRISPSAVDPETPFALMGLDSLAAIELAVELEQALRLEVHADLLTDCTNVRTLAARLGQGTPPSPTDDRFDLMLADSVLPEGITPAGSPARSGGLADAQSILLTGATGFLGASLLRALLERSSAEILCLVRPGTTPPRVRLQQCLDSFAVPVDASSPRITIVEGDLRHPHLGLREPEFRALAGRVDAICHAGAAVNWVSSYNTLRAPNVTGTLELLRLACLARPIPFHFVSSLSVCYSTSAPADVDESFDPLPHLRGVHLGYAQTKIVAEALVREAGDRGLPITIARPAVISGDSGSGAFNPDDVLAALIRGCVRMGVAPDLDWQLDCEPVDFIAEAIVHLSQHRGRTFHLSHARPRHWRECVLWMRLYGYPIRLVSYHAWLRQLDRETAPSGAADHPLRPLRTFFLDRPADANGLTLPELYEDVRRSSARGERTLDALAAGDVVCPPLDAALLQTYFDAYVSSGQLPPPPTRQPSAAGDSAQWDTAFFERVFGNGTRVRGVTPLGSGSDHSIISELAAWRTGRPSGLFRFLVDVENDGRIDSRDVVLKVKPSDRQVIAVGEAVARVCHSSVGEAYAQWGDRIGFTAGHLREPAIYAQSDPRFTRHAPRLLGTLADPANSQWTLAIEHVRDGVLMDSTMRPESWTHAHLESAVGGLASLHAIWYGREAELRSQPWIGHVPGTSAMAEMTGLWSALADHAGGAFSSWGDPAIGSIQRRLIDTIPDWWPLLERVPRTLIHNDFNPRNICLRPTSTGHRLCAYDWELATIGAPQHDLAELLCFLLPPTATAADIDGWIERHRLALMHETGDVIDTVAWQHGFRAAVYDLMVNRLPMYTLVHRIRRQPFLPRLVRTWCRLYEHVEATANC